MTTPESLHASYMRLSGRDLKFTMAHLFIWERWLHRGWTEADLRLVIDQIKAGIKRGVRKPGALKFANLIENTERFADDLAEYQAIRTVPTIPTGRAAVLKATGRVETPNQQDPQKVSEVLHRMAKEWRQQQGIV